MATLATTTTTSATSATTASGSTGTSFNYQITVSGGTSPYTYQMTGGSLPTGLTLASNGLLSGKPTVGGTFYAVENSCPHQGGPLAEGWIEGPIVTCPWHAWCFDVRTGKMTLSEFAAVEVFDVQLVDSTLAISSEPRA